MKDEDVSGRDLRVMWRTVAVVALVAASVVGGIITAVAWSVRMDARLEAVEKWQEAKDKAAARELWRRERERPQPSISPGLQ